MTPQDLSKHHVCFYFGWDGATVMGSHIADLLYNQPTCYIRNCIMLNGGNIWLLCKTPV